MSGGPLSAQDILSTIEAGALEGVLAQAQRIPGAAMYDTPQILRITSSIPYALPFCNSIMRTQLTDDTCDAAIDAIVADCRERNVPVYWAVDAASQPATLADRLVAHGFRQGRNSILMAADLTALDNHDRPMASTAGIRRVRNAEMSQEWMAVFAAAFSMPMALNEPYAQMCQAFGFEETSLFPCFTGYLDGVPVATSAVLYTESCAWVYDVATLEAAQRRGIGTAITLATMRAAQAHGYRLIGLFATDQGYPVYQKLGFQKLGMQQAYIWKP